MSGPAAPEESERVARERVGAVERVMRNKEINIRNSSEES